MVSYAARTQSRRFVPGSTSWRTVSVLAGYLLKQLAEGAVQAGYDVVACPAPLQPERLEHLLIPSFARVLTGTAAKCKGKPYRRIRFDAMPDQGLVRSCRARLRFARRVSELLQEEAIAALAEVRDIQRRIEALYEVRVDHDKADQAAEEIKKSMECATA
jgi:hypothetical protein